MITQREVYNVVITGAGRSSLACVIESKKHSLNHLVIDKDYLVNSICYFPTHVTLFSTSDLPEIGGISFIFPAKKPQRTELLTIGY